MKIKVFVIFLVIIGVALVYHIVTDTIKNKKPNNPILSMQTERKITCAGEKYKMEFYAVK